MAATLKLIERAACIRGHEFTEANTRTHKLGYRVCRKCVQIRKAKNYPPRRTRAAQYAISKHHRQLWLTLYPTHPNDDARRRARNNQKLRKIARTQAAVNELKDAPCTDCGVKYPSEAMEFDHLPGFKKVLGVSDLTSKGKSIDVVMEEIAKCELVCANCHRIRTSKRRREARGK